MKTNQAGEGGDVGSHIRVIAKTVGASRSHWRLGRGQGQEEDGKQALNTESSELWGSAAQRGN